MMISAMLVYINRGNGNEVDGFTRDNQAYPKLRLPHPVETPVTLPPLKGPEASKPNNEFLMVMILEGQLRLRTNPKRPSLLFKVKVSTHL